MDRSFLNMCTLLLLILAPAFAQQHNANQANPITRIGSGYCNPHHWLNEQGHSDEECRSLVQSSARCVEKRWMMRTEHDRGLCGCMTQTGECSVDSSNWVAAGGYAMFTTGLETSAGMSAWHDGILGGGWQLVRRVQAGNAWHPSTDQLMGTDVYGSFVDNPTADATFSIAYDVNRVSEFLFATGDGQKWLVASKDSVVGGFYANELRPIIASSKSATGSSARWYRRQGAREDPWISLSDHHTAIGAGEILYKGAGIGSTQFAILPHHNGANVFVRFQPGARRMLKVGRLLSMEGALFYNHGDEAEIY